MLTMAADIKPSGAFTVASIAALGADKDNRPSKLEKILNTGLLVTKTSIILNLVVWEILFHRCPLFSVWRPPYIALS